MESSLPPDPYLALGVPKDATSAAIKAAHRKLVLKCHPDKVTNPDEKQAASDLFHKIQSSYEILIDDARRSRYDAEVSLAELKRERRERRSDEGVRGHHDSRSVPRSSKDSYFKDAYYPRAPEGMAPQFEERRPDYAATTTTPAAATAAEFDEVPSRANMRKDPEAERSSRRTTNDVKEKTKPVARDFSRERQRVHREERKQKSQKENRRDRDRKYSTYMEDESESNSDGYSSRRRTREEEPPSLRHAREEYYEKVDRQAKQASEGNLDDRTRKMFSQHAKAWDYINQSNSRTRSQVESERRPSPTRVGSHKDVPVMVRRSSNKPKTDDREDQSRRRRDHARRSPERFEEIHRPPPFLKSMSSPLELRIPSEKSRSHDDSKVPILKNPELKRAETYQTYTTSRRTETVAPSKSGYRPTDFSDGLPTPGMTPTYEVSPTSSFPYTYRKQYADDAEYPTPDGYRTSGDASNVEVREPRRGNRGAFTRRVTRSPSPMSESHEPRERPRMTNMRYPSSASQTMPSSATRTTSYVYPGSGQGVEQVDRSSRQNSGRSGVSTNARDMKQLYGEITPPRQKSDGYPKVSYAPPMRMDSTKTYPYKVSTSERPPAVPRSSSNNPVLAR